MQTLNTHKFSLGARHQRRRNEPVTLRLTSMIDMFTILLVFLLKSYSAEGQILTVSDNLTLPNSTAQRAPVSTPIVTVTQDLIMMDDEPVAEIESTISTNELEILALSQILSEKRQIAERLGVRDKSLGFKGNVTIQGDRTIPFRILKKIMFTCGKQGFNNIYLAVLKQE